MTTGTNGSSMTTVYNDYWNKWSSMTTAYNEYWNKWSSMTILK